LAYFEVFAKFLLSKSQIFANFIDPLTNLRVFLQKILPVKIVTNTSLSIQVKR